jgi:hypothetical protein
VIVAEAQKTKVILLTAKRVIYMHRVIYQQPYILDLYMDGAGGRSLLFSTELPAL